MNHDDMWLMYLIWKVLHLAGTLFIGGMWVGSAIRFSVLRNKLDGVLPLAAQSIALSMCIYSLFYDTLRKATMGVLMT